MSTPPAALFIPDSARKSALASIQEELDEVLPTLGLVEARLRQRTNFNLEIIPRPAPARESRTIRGTSMAGNR